MKIFETISSIRALGNRFGLMLSAGLLSDIGGFMTHTALMLHVYQLTGHDKRYMGLVALATMGPFLFAAPVGGVWAERFDRKRVMIALDLIRFPLVLCLMAVENVWAILSLQAILSAGTAAFNPSRMSIIPELVKEKQIHLANSMNGGSLSLVHAIAPVLGATIYAATGSLRWIVLLDGISYLLSAALLFFIQYQKSAPEKEAEEAKSEGMLSDVIKGFAYVRKEKDILHIVTIATVAGCAIGLLLPLLRPFVDEVLRGDEAIYGWVIGAFGLGGVLGPALGFYMGKKLGLGRTIVTAFLIEASLLVIWSRVTDWRMSAILLLVWGLNVFMLIPCFMSYMHTYAKKEYMGRVFAVVDQAHFMPHLLMACVVVVVGEKIPTQNLLTSVGLLYVFVVLATWGTEGSRLLRSRRGESSGAGPTDPPTGDAIAEAEPSPATEPEIMGGSPT